MKLTIEIETDDLNILKLIAKAAYVKPESSRDLLSGGDKQSALSKSNDPLAASLLREVSRLRNSASQMKP